MRTELQISATAPAGWRQSLGTDARDALLFGICYLVLDWASYLYPFGQYNITPWNPPPALSIVWMMLGGLRYVPVVFAAILTSDVLVRHAPGGLPLTTITALVLALGYAGIAAALRARFRFDARRIDTRQLWTFIGVTTIGIALLGVLYISVLWIAGVHSSATLPGAVFRFWLGDTVGVLVTAPLLLVAADPGARARLLESWRRRETWLQFLVLFLTVAVIFAMGEPQNYFYPLFLPVIWIALRGGFSGAAAASAVVQAGVVLYSAGESLRTATVLELQAVVSALTLTGLFLGVLMEERERALEDLKRSLRLAAAGELAGAIAHEINQPLAAMRNYGNACRLLMEQGNGAASTGDLTAIVEKMLAESRRAAEVVGRLRDFFLAGTTHLAPVAVQTLLDSVQSVGNKLNAADSVAFEVRSTHGRHRLLADRVQIELILRNLVANAFDAVSVLPPGQRRVSVATHTTADDRIVFRVSDNGAGVPPLLRARLFEPFASRKATGMGIGLSFSRAIAEAHGGALRANDRPCGEFDLILPLEPTDD